MGTVIEVNNVNDVCEYWKRAINSFDSNIPLTTNTSSNGFSILEEVGFDCTSLQKYNTNVNELSDYINEYYNAVKRHIDLMNDDDTYLYNHIPKKEAKVSSVSANGSISVNANISSSDMSDRASDRERLNSSQGAGTSSYGDNYTARGTILTNINGGTAGTVSQMNDYTVRGTNLTNISNDNGLKQATLDMGKPTTDANLTNINNGNGSIVQNINLNTNDITMANLGRN